ncbi:hypothetical protein ACFL3T_00485 [Patescibacteria group bacterium]
MNRLESTNNLGSKLNVSVKIPNKLLAGIMVLVGTLVSAACNTDSKPVFPPERPKRPKNPADSDTFNRTSSNNESANAGRSNTPERQIRIDESTGEVYIVLSKDELKNMDHSQVPIHFDPKTGEYYRVLSDSEKCDYGHLFQKADNSFRHELADDAEYTKRFDERINKQFGEFIKGVMQKQIEEGIFTEEELKSMTPIEFMEHLLNSFFAIDSVPENQRLEGRISDWSLGRNKVPVDLLIMLALRKKGSEGIVPARFYAAERTNSDDVLGHLAYDVKHPRTAESILGNPACKQYIALRLLENKDPRIQQIAAESPLMPRKDLLDWIEKTIIGGPKISMKEYLRNFEKDSSGAYYGDDYVMNNSKLNDDDLKGFLTSPHTRLAIAVIKSGRLSMEEITRIIGE